MLMQTTSFGQQTSAVTINSSGSVINPQTITFPNGAVIDGGTNGETGLPFEDISLGASINPAQFGYSLNENTNATWMPQLPVDGTSLYESKVHWFYNSMNPVVNYNAVAMMFIGDSAMNSGQSAIMSGIYNGVRKYMSWGGGLGDWDPMGGASEWTASSSGATWPGYPGSFTPDTNWFSFYWTLTANGCLTNADWWNGANGYVPHTNADTVTVIYLRGPYYGTFDVYQMPSYQGGGALKLASINAYNAVYGGYVTNFTLPALTNIMCYVSNTSSSNNIIAMGAETIHSHTVQFFNFSTGGQDPEAWTNVNTNVFIPIMKALNPSIVLMEDRNDSPYTMALTYSNYLNFWSNAIPTNDLVCLGTYQIYPGDQGYSTLDLLNAGIRSAAQGANRWYMDLRNLMPDPYTMTNLGWYIDGVHLKPTTIREGGEIWNELEKQLGGINLLDTNYFQGIIYNQYGSKSSSGGSQFTNLFNSQLLMYLPLDEGVGTTMGDVSGNGLNGYDHLGTGTNWVTGKFGYAYQFQSNVSDYLTVANSSYIPTLMNGFTASCWFNSSNVPYATINAIQLFVKYNTGTDGTLIFQWYGTGIGLAGNDTNCVVTLNVISNSLTTVVNKNITTPHICDGNWHFLALSYNNSYVFVQVDTNVCGSNYIGNYSITNSGQSLIVGSGDVQYIMDDVRIYSPALTTNDLTYLYQTGSASYTQLPSGLSGINTNTVKTVFSPYEFGAYGDNIHDDTIPMENCFTAANLVPGSTVWLNGNFKPGFSVNSVSIVTNEGMTIKDGKLNTSNTNIAILQLLGNRYKLSYVEFGGPGYTSWGTNTSFGLMIGSNAYISPGFNIAPQEIILEHIKMTNFYMGVYINNATELYAYNCQITACESNDIYITNNFSGEFDHCTFGNSDIENPGTPDMGSLTNSIAIFVDNGAARVNIRNCDENFSGSFVKALAGAVVLEYDNIESQMNPIASTVYGWTNASLKVQFCTFNPAKTGQYSPVVNQQPITIWNPTSFIGPNSYGSGAISPPVEYYNYYQTLHAYTSAFPGVFGEMTSQQPLLRLHQTTNDVGTVNYGPLQSFYNQSSSYDFGWNDDCGSAPYQIGYSMQLGGNYNPTLIGNNLLSYGYTQNYEKVFSIAAPAYGFSPVYGQGSTVSPIGMLSWSENGPGTNSLNLGGVPWINRPSANWINIYSTPVDLGESSTSYLDWSIYASNSPYASSYLFSRIGVIGTSNIFATNIYANNYYGNGNNLTGVNATSISGSTLFGSYYSQPIVARWLMNNSNVTTVGVIDSVGTNNLDSVAITCNNNAYDFNGSSSYAAIPSGTAFPIPFTVSMWIQPTNAYPAGGAALITGNDTGNYAPFLRINSVGQLDFLSSAYADYAQSTGNILSNQATFTQVGCSFDGTNIIFYINGTNSGSTSVTTNVGMSSSYLSIGYCDGTYFNGAMKDCLMYSGILPASQMAEIYSNGPQTVIPNGPITNNIISPIQSTNIVSPTNNSIVINFNGSSSAEGNIVTNATINLSAPTGVAAAFNNNYLLHVNNTSVSVIAINPYTGPLGVWHTNAGGTFNCTNNSDVYIHVQQGVTTNMAVIQIN